MQQPQTPSRWLRRATFAAALLALAGGLLVAWSLLRERDDLSRTNSNLQLLDLPVIENPCVLPAASVRLQDDVPVIGVSIGGRHRAYVLEAFAPLDQHVVNDHFGGAPVSVTYCDRTDCVRVFTAPGQERTLDLAVGGWVGRYEEGTLVLGVGSNHYRQTTGEAIEETAPPFPYRDVDFVRTTWKHWHDAHPDSDVYIGEPPPRR